MSGSRLFGPGTALPPPGPGPGSGALPRTALPVHAGVPRHLEAHFHRLEAGAAALGQGAAWLPGLREPLTTWLEAATGMGNAALRLVLDPGAAVLSAHLEPLPWAPQPCQLVPMRHPLGSLRADPTARHKGLSGPWGRAILAEAQRLGGDDALLLWPDGTVAETAIAAVGVEAGGVLAMPPIQGRVASLTERLDLPAWARSRGLRIEMKPLTLPSARAGAIWCMNALRGIWPATLL
jgi:branched-subunit amino acid aminotransferase/4-amino-4-deoxychorismate lyase